MSRPRIRHEQASRGCHRRVSGASTGPMLTSMRLLSLDFDPVYGEDTIRAKFSDQNSVFDYDIVIWDPSSSLSNYSLDALYSMHGSRTLTEGSSVQNKADIKRRHDEGYSAGRVEVQGDYS